MTFHKDNIFEHNILASCSLSLCSQKEKENQIFGSEILLLKYNYLQENLSRIGVK